MSQTAVLGRRRGSRWTKVGHGLYVAAVAAWHLVLPASGAFGHLTAAALHGLWLPPLPDGTPTFVAVRDGGTAPRRAGLRVVRHACAIPTVPVRGLPTPPVAETVLSCARDLALQRGRPPPPAPSLAVLTKPRATGRPKRPESFVCARFPPVGIRST